MRKFVIRTVERATKIKAHTIRVWEKRYSLLPPERTSGNRRMYSPFQMAILLDIALLTRYGTPVSKVAIWPEERRCLAIDQLSNTSAGADVLLHELLKAFYKGDADRFECVIDHFTNRYGQHSAVTDLMVNFLDRSNHYELKYGDVIARLLQNIIRNKLIVAINRLHRVKPADVIAVINLSKKFSEVEVLISCYLLIKAGGNPVYIEPRFSRNSFNEIISNYRPKKIIAYAARESNSKISEMEKIGVDHPSSEIIIITSPERKILANNCISYLEVASLVDDPHK